MTHEKDIASLRVFAITVRGTSNPPIIFTITRPPLKQVWEALENGYGHRKQDIAALRFCWRDTNSLEFVIDVGADGIRQMPDDEFPCFMDEQLSKWLSTR